MQRVQRRAAEDSRVKVAGSRPDPDVQVDEPPRRDVEQRHVALEHPGVEDHAGVGATLVGGEKIDDRLPARLLLAVATKPQVDRQRVGGLQFFGGLELHVELALVVSDPARIDAPVPNSRFEGIRIPEIERRRWLDIEVSVADDRGALAVPGRRGDLPDRQRLPLPVAKLGLAARAAQELTDPFARSHDIHGAFGVRADAGNADELGELLEPGLIHGA